ncbi:MAG: CoA-acylating methylmalonate-semialdehyde dehydrogenase [Acidimicrobiaceae bacterium]|nr:CoA-acylating methylmalonate-semialdehyde dehydrogenase [Acidimicrobiaceae bacterium]
MTLEIVPHFIDNKSVPSRSNRTSEVFNPATGAVTKLVGLADASEVDGAVSSSAAAFASWSDTSLAQRTRILFAFREILEERAQEVAKLITQEHGKVLSDALGEVKRGQEVLEFACGISQLLKGSLSDQVSKDVDTYSIRQPLGVVAGITPFNFPAMVPMWMFPIAIAAGNTFVLKPSEKDPSASFLLAEMFREAGLPEGVFNVVQGDKVAVDALLGHPKVKAISFVGSTPIARYIYENAASERKRVQALGGAKNHMVVLPDADVENAASAAVSAAYGSAGERCMAISVVVAVGGVADELVTAIQTKMANLNIGPGDLISSEMGPLVTRAHRDRVASYIDSAVRQGAKVIADGRNHPLYSADSGGFFLGASLVDEVRPEMDVYKDEIFGPVLAVVRVEDFQQAIDFVNSNPYANGAAIFTRDGGAARRFQRSIDAGMVGINVPIPVPVAYYSFGGAKDSLFGDTHVHGEDGIRFYTKVKAVTSRWPEEHREGVDFGFPQNR